HCHLGHINKKRIKKLQHDWLLKSTDDDSFDKFVSCMSDYGGEYISQEFLDHLKKHEIISQFTPPYTPQHNGVSERRNRTLLDMVRSMSNQTTLSKSFWDYALKSVARILNMVLTKKVENTPYEVWHGQAPKLSYLKSYITRTKWHLKDLEVIQEEDTHPSENTREHHDEDEQEIIEPLSDVCPVHRSTRTPHALDRMCLYVDAEEHELGDHNEPTNYKAALSDPEYDNWLEVLNVEIQSMKDNQVWDLVDLPPNGLTVGSKLKQASKQWNKRFNEEIKKFGFTQNHDEPCVYVKASGINVTFLILYVDDILIMRNHIPMLQDVKSYLGKCFAMKDLGEATYIIGIKIYRDRSRQLIGLRQIAYIEKILKRFNMENSKRGSISTQENQYRARLEVLLHLLRYSAYIEFLIVIPLKSDSSRR
ncbi:retrotransposon protein, putative, ty1-copia subclass, partial [Tanacetum coccineum]